MFPTVTVLLLAIVVVAAFWRDALSDEDRSDSNVTRPVAAISSEESPDSTELHALRSEIRALRVELRKVLSHFEQDKAIGPRRTAEAAAVEVSENTKIFEIESVAAYSVAEAIERMIPDARVSVLEDENRLLVVAERMQQVADAIKILDRPRRQVRINSYIYDIPVDEVARLGLVNSEDSTGPLGSHFLGKSLQQAITQLGQADGVRLLARPNIRAYDRTTAEFSSVSEIPIQTLTETAEGGSIGTTEFREVGIRLEVTPRITAGGTIIMEVQPEYSVLNGFVEEQPIIDRLIPITSWEPVSVIKR